MNEQYSIFDDDELGEVSDSDSQLELAERMSGILAEKLRQTGMFDVIEHKFRFGEVHVNGRIDPESQQAWCYTFMQQMLFDAKFTNPEPIEFMIYKQFIPVGDDFHTGSTRYFWAISLSSDDLAHDVGIICNAIDKQLPKKQDVTEVPLLGPPSPVGSGVAKGARPLRA